MAFYSLAGSERENGRKQNLVRVSQFTEAQTAEINHPVDSALVIADTGAWQRGQRSFEPDHRQPALAQTTFFYRFTKRTIDILGALSGLILLFPVFLILYWMVRFGSKGPAFHRRRVLRQQTLSAEGLQEFDAFKFRTMVVDADAVLNADPTLMAEYRKAFKLQHDPRITRIGGPLRRTSLDELPQLWNVLIGQMSLVGPRMITAPELSHYGSDSARLLSVKPGLTGLWQVSGRTNVSYHERVRLDMYYIENRSLKMDIEILLRTVVCVLARKGAI